MSDNYIEGLRVAMLGTTDGDFIDPDSDIPAGEMFRLASEYANRMIAQVRAEAYERCAEIAEGNLGRRWVVSETPRDIAARIREQGRG